MSKAPNWKDEFRDAMFESVDLQKRKIHRDLLQFLVHKANTKSRSCWASRREMARVQGCSIRNIKDIIRDLRDIGALLQVRFSELPHKDQQDINAISPRAMKGTANVYFLCLGWAEDILSGGQAENARPGSIGISVADRKRGTDRANDRKRRYGPPVDVSDIDLATTPEHDEWLALNAVGEKWDVPTTPIRKQKGDVPTTDITTEYKQAAKPADNIGRALAEFSPRPSKAEQAESLISSLPDHARSTDQHGYGGGAASAMGQGTKFLAGLGGAHEETEYDAAGARAIDRRVS